MLTTCFLCTKPVLAHPDDFFLKKPLKINFMYEPPILLLWLLLIFNFQPSLMQSVQSCWTAAFPQWQSRRISV